MLENLIDGYKSCTTFWQDFSIADVFGADAVKDTYERGLDYAKTDYKALTEFVLVLNYKSWQHHGKGNDELCKVYCDLYEKANDYAWDNLEGEEQEYYYRTTD